MIAMLVVVGTVFAAIPIQPAEAQWVFVARKVIGRVEKMQHSGQQG